MTMQPRRSTCSKVSLDGEERHCPAGSFVFIPYFPAAMTGYFDDLAAALRRADVTESELAQIAVAHQMRIVGPPSAGYV
jgi:hypothetical protein